MSTHPDRPEFLRSAQSLSPTSLYLFLVRYLVLFLGFVAIAVIPAFSQTAPVAEGAVLSTNEDVPLSGALSARSADNNPLTFHPATAPRHGRIEISTGGGFVYTPDLNFNGYDKFGFVAKGAGRSSTEATVFVTVNPVNDAPTASAMEFKLPENRTLVGQLQGQDVDGDALVYTKTSSPQQGTLTVGPDGRFEFVGTEDNVSFSYVVSDGSATSSPATVAITVVTDAVGFIADIMLPKVTSADFPPGPDGSLFPQVTLPDAANALDMAADRMGHRLYVLTPQALKIYEINNRAHPATLLFRRSVSISGMNGTRLCLSLDGRTAFIGGAGKVSALNLYPEAVFTTKKFLWIPYGSARSIMKDAFENPREYTFPDALEDRSVAAMGVHPAGDRLFVVVDMDPAEKKLALEGNGLLLSEGKPARLPGDFGYITQLHIDAEVESSATEREERGFASPINLKDLIYPHGKIAIDPRSLAFSPDGNCALIAAVGAQTLRGTAFGLMPTSDEGTGGIVVLDVRPVAAPEPWVKYLGFIPTTEKGENTAQLRQQIVQEGRKIVHPVVQWARYEYLAALGQYDLGSSNRDTAPRSLNALTSATKELAILEGLFRDYGYMQAYVDLYPHDMVGASSVALNHRGDFGIVTLQHTNNLGLLSVVQSSALAGYTGTNPPDFYIAVGTGKTVNGFDAETGSSGGQSSHQQEQSGYSWAYPQEVAFTSDDSRVYIGMPGGTPKSNLTNKFGTANASTLRTERDRPDSPHKAANPAPGYELLGATALMSPRIAATLPGLASDHDQLSDALKAYNRWNFLRVIANDPDGTKKARLVSTDVEHLATPGQPMAYKPGTADALKFGFLVPTSGVGFRRNTFGQPSDTTNFASRAVVTALEQLGVKWAEGYHQFLRSREVNPNLPITRPYFLVGLLGQPGGGVRQSPQGDALKYSPSTGFEVDFPYFTIDSDAAHEFVTTNDPYSPTNNRGETKKGFDQQNTAALLRLLLNEPHVKTIELDPYVLDLLPEFKGRPQIIPHGSRTIRNSRRDLDDHMFVTFAQLRVDLGIDSDNDGVLDRTPEEDALEDRPGTGAKFVLPNLGDANGNLVPDYADGYDLFPGGESANASARFTPIVIRFPDELDLAKTQFRLHYAGSDPAQVTRSENAPYAYTLPGTGGYRIWAKDGDQPRKKAQIDQQGDYIAPDVAYWVTDLLARAGTAGTNRSVIVYLESVKPESQPDQNKVAVEIIPEEAIKKMIEEIAGSSALSDSVRVASGFASLAVDANRDGQIRFASEDGSDATDAAQPFRFWLNDDDDEGDNSLAWSDPDPEHYPPRRADSADHIINNPRDCEDLARIWISAAGLIDMVNDPAGDLYLGLKWTNTSDTQPSIRLFRSADTSGGLAHVKNAAIGAQQAGGAPGSVNAMAACLGDVDAEPAEFTPRFRWNGLVEVKRTNREVADFIFRKDALPEIFGNRSTGYLLFEGVQEGKGELMFVIVHKKSDGTWEKVSDGGSVWLQLDNIRRMYLRVHSTPFDSGFPYPWAQESPPAEPYVEDTSTTGKPITILPSKLGFALGDTGQDDGNYGFVPSPDEQAKCVVFVHGIDMTVDAQRGYSQSFFKRLWWEGYRGRLIAFRWNTPLSGLENWLWGDPNFSIFNSGEYRSWKAGTSLNKLATALRDSTSSFYFKPNAVIGLVAHSLGNACATEALKQGAPFDSYIAMEAAIPLSCFYTSSLFVDPQPPTVARLLDAETQKATPQYTLDGGYQGYLHDSPGLAAPRKVSYNNQNDFWLATGTLVNKTEVNWIKNEASYKPDDRMGLGQYAYNPGYFPYFMRGTSFSRSATDPHETMSFASRSRSRALGAGVPGGSFGSTSSSSVDLAFSYQFGAARFDHSGQFQRNIQLMYGDDSGTQWRDSSTGQVLSLYRRLMRDLQIDQ